ncbi:hypothetical protein BKA69DRAFT_1128682 [Paraphysoderma sedebokerense]|nr:hypothetical protein BKA69DRAFT_1128682 [Paraphysoderma sedebokerense]
MAALETVKPYESESELQRMMVQYAIIDALSILLSLIFAILHFRKLFGRSKSKSSSSSSYSNSSSANSNQTSNGSLSSSGSQYLSPIDPTTVPEQPRSSPRHMTIFKQLTIVAVFYLLASIFKFFSDQLCFSNSFNGLATGDTYIRCLSLSFLRVGTESLGFGFFAIVGLKRLGLFEALIRSDYIRKLPRIFTFITAILTTIHVIFYVVTCCIQIAMYPASVSREFSYISDIRLTVLFVFYGWVIIMNSFVDVSIIYYVFKTKAKIMELKNPKVTRLAILILIILIFNLTIMVLALSLDIIERLVAVPEFLARIYVIGGAYCLSKVKKLSSVGMIRGNTNSQGGSYVLKSWREADENKSSLREVLRSGVMMPAVLEVDKDSNETVNDVPMIATEMVQVNPNMQENIHYENDIAGNVSSSVEYSHSPSVLIPIHQNDDIQ